MRKLCILLIMLISTVVMADQSINNEREPVVDNSSQVTYKAKCEVKNELYFNYGQVEAGYVEGSFDQIITDCEERAKAMFGGLSSSGVKDLTILSDASKVKTAQCHIDNDLQYTEGQIVVGTVAGKSKNELSDNCKRIAYHAFGNFSSSGLVF